MQPWAFLADALVLLHAGYVLFVVVGLVLIVAGIIFRWAWVRNFWFRLLHLVAIVVVGLEAAIGIQCPLTEVERVLRIRAGQQYYEGDFIVHWANRLLYIESLPQWAFNLAHILFALVVLAVFLWAPPRWPWKRASRQPVGTGS